MTEQKPQDAATEARPSIREAKLGPEAACVGRFTLMGQTGPLDEYAKIYFECPKCLRWAGCHPEQFFGRVSMVCECGWHETHNLAEVGLFVKPSITFANVERRGA